MPETCTREITAKEICERFGIPYSTVNHYTDLGLFPIVRKCGNKRIYDSKKVEDTYERITRLATEGYPLSLIRKKMSGSFSYELL